MQNNICLHANKTCQQNYIIRFYEINNFKMKKVYWISPRAPKRKTKSISKRKTIAPIIEIAPVAHVRSILVVFGGQ